MQGRNLTTQKPGAHGKATPAATQTGSGDQNQSYPYQANTAITTDGFKDGDEETTQHHEGTEQAIAADQDVQEPVSRDGANRKGQESNSKLKNMLSKLKKGSDPNEEDKKDDATVKE